MVMNMSSRKLVNCTQCSKEIKRVVWNYGKNRPILNFFCDNTCKGQWQKEQRESLGYTKDWLIDQYHTQGKSANQIAREVGRDSKRVWEWIRDYGIETRPRGTDYGQCFQVGQESTFKGKKHKKETKEKIRQKSLEDGRVPYLKDGKHWLHHEGAVPGNWKGGITPERQAFYSTIEWSEAVKAVWARDNAICQECGKHHNTEKNRGNFHIHHIVSFKVPELRANVDNLVLLCKSCHRWVHSKKNTKNKWIIES